MIQHWTEDYRDMGACKLGIDLARKYPTRDAWWRRTRQDPHMIWVLVREYRELRDEIYQELSYMSAKELREIFPTFPPFKAVHAAVRAHAKGRHYGSAR